MPKEIKKHVTRGAPLWMAQYVVLVLILIVFFMILISMSKTQQGGMKSGDGDVKNIAVTGGDGGVGIFKFGRYGTGTYMPTPNFFKKGVYGVDKDLTIGKGGAGDTDADFTKNDEGKYLRVNFPFQFEKGSHQLTKPMKEELSKMGLAFSLYESKVNVKCYTDEMANENENLRLSFMRAAQIMRGLHNIGGVPYSKLDFSSYPSERYLGKKDAKGGKGKQEMFFYVYIPGIKADDDK